MTGKLRSMAVLAVIVLGVASPAWAAEEKASTPPAGEMARYGVLFTDMAAGKLGSSLGVALVVIGAGLAISRIGISACESIARQPEAGGRIFTSMMISAALVEGAALLSIIVCMLVALNLTF